MPTILPDDFVFSQSNLQVFANCARRFWFSYVQRLPWPAVEASPVQEHEYVMRLGDAFHRAVQRAEAGIPAELIAAQLQDPLDTWFDDYLRHRPRDLPTTLVESETVLTIPFQSSRPWQSDGPLQSSDPLQSGEQAPTFRLAAKYDLLAIEPGQRAVILDWKTTRRRTEPHHLRQRLQSQVYPYLVVEASANVPWGPLLPEQVEMRYWFTAAPYDPVILRYDAAQHAENHQILQRLVAQIIAGENEADFPKLPDTEINRARVCAYCTYRSRCNRGIAAGDLDNINDFEDVIHDADLNLEISLADVVELAF